MSFKQQIGAFKARAEKAALFVFRGTALDLFTNVIYRTPVGNPSIWESGKAPPGYTGGRLRGGWQININRASDKQTGNIDGDGGATIRSGNAKIRRARVTDSIYMTNNLPYALAVEHGHSKQAPRGMVKVTVAEFNRLVEKRAKKAK